MAEALRLAPKDPLLARLQEAFDNLNHQRSDLVLQESPIATGSGSYGGWGSDYRFLLLEGLSAYLENAFDEAAQAWTQARSFYSGFAELRSFIERAKREKKTSNAFKLTQAPHFVFIYDGRVENSTAQKIADMLETGYDENGRAHV